MLLNELTVDAETFRTATGWESKPEGLCRGEICVPAPDSRTPTGAISVDAAAARLGMPLVHDEATKTWALGPSTLSGRALATATVPPLSLTTFDGTPFDLASLRGRKVVLASWASW
jgi:hypothetical protein